MYRVKERGRGGRYAMFGVDRREAPSPPRPDVAAALRPVIERGEMEVHYEPQVSLADRRIIGAEAQVRWNHSEPGLLPSARIPVAEAKGTTLQIGRQVLEQACRQARTWRQEFGVTLQMGVNLSARHFHQVDLAEDIALVLRATAIDPSQVCLEITESLAMEDVELTSAVVTELHALGVRVAIDDFGSGPSSLGCLARLPVDVVKIDQGFGRDIDRDPVKSGIVSAVVELSQATGSTTVVQGVETTAQLEEFKILGCDVAQGYSLSRPLSAGAFGQLLTATRRSAADDLSVDRWARAG